MKTENTPDLLKELRSATYSYVLFFMFAAGILVGNNTGWWYVLKCGMLLGILIFALMIGAHQRKLVDKIKQNMDCSNQPPERTG